MSSSAPPARSSRTSSDVAALVAELARVIKGRRFYGAGSAQLPRLFERALRAWQAELERHGDLEIHVADDGLRVPGLPEGAFGAEFSTLRGMLAQRGFRSLRVEAGLDAEGFAALLEVLVSDVAKLAREGGVERALYARAPVGFVVNGNAPELAAPAAPPAADAEPVAEAAAPVAQTRTTGTPEPPAAAVEKTDAAAAIEAPEPAAEAPQVVEPDPPAALGPAELEAPPAPEPALEAAAEAAEEPRPEPERDGALEVPAEQRPVLLEAPPGFDPTLPPLPEPAPAVDHDALPPIPPSLLGPEPAEPGPTFADELDPALSSPAAAGAAERVERAAEPDEDAPQFVFSEPPALEDAAPDLEDAAPGLDEEPTEPGFDDPAFEDAPTLSLQPPLAAPASPKPPELDFGGEPLELEEEPDDHLDTGAEELEFAPDEPPPRQDATPAFEDAPGTPGPAAPRPTEPSAEGYVADMLRDLDDCGDDILYRELAERAARTAEKLAEQGLESDAYVLLSALVAHAGDGSKRSPVQREVAGGHALQLAGGPLLDTLLARACGEGDGGLEANQILAQLGGDVVVPLFRAATAERSAERRERLHGVLIAMGDEALPELLRLMRDENPSRARAAVRLAGELQNPAAVGRLAELLESDNAALCQEVSKALVRIGDSTAIRTLAQALESPVAHVPGLAAYALGASSSDLAVEALLGALDKAVEQGKTEFAREVIRSLGRLGRVEATPDLAAILLRRGLMQRRRHRELKLAAAAALGRLPGDEAVGALAQAAQSRDAHIRRAAQIALDRRAQALAG